MSKPQPGAGPAPSRPILVVDDDRKIVALVRAYLEREGYRVISAYDGREALQRARRTTPPSSCWTSCCPRWTAWR